MRKKAIIISALLLSFFLLTACKSDKKPTSGKEKRESTVIKKQELTAEELQRALSEQPLAVDATNCLVQSTKYKAIFPDMLQAVIVNHTDCEIKRAVVAFAAWDEDGLPVKIKGRFAFDAPTYIKEVRYDNIHLVSGGRYGEYDGFGISKSLCIKSVKAIAVSYETLDGEKWENPYYADFKNRYEGKNRE